MRKWNFCAGPATMPESVLKETQEELLEWKNSGMSVMEMSHRSDLYMNIANEAKKDLGDLINLPDTHDILFLQGGATSQFALIPLNFSHLGEPEYLLTGSWSKKAIAEAEKITKLNVVASSADDRFTYVPEYKDWILKSKTSYFHYVSNETIQGNTLHTVPNIPNPIVCDMSSAILAEPINVSDFSMIYAGAQKNIGPAGLTIVIIEKDFLDQCSANIPNIFNYAQHSTNGSMLNTPPTFAWYMAGKVFKWLKSIGGLEKMQLINQKKAKTLYDFIDSSSFYSNPVRIENRSLMNVPFVLQDANLDSRFLDESFNANLLNLKGHRSVGGMRASIYNAIPQEAIDDLIIFMKAFEAKYG